MPLVAHPVRSLWGSQPRCARCVCEWLHRKWDGATGVFSVDFPSSPKVPKGKGKKSKGTARQELELSGAESDVTTVMPTQTQELTVSGPPSGTSDSDIVIQPSGFITSRRKRKRSTSNKSRSSHVRDRDYQHRVQPTEVTKRAKRGKVHLCRKELV